MARKPRILCVDDRSDGSRVRTMLLEQFGCEAIAVYDCQSALRVVSEREIDLLLIDYHLAGEENGEDLARDVRVIRPQIPLVILSGDPKLPASVSATVDAVLIKGTTNPAELLDLIQKLVPGATLRPRPTRVTSEPERKAC